MDTEKRHKTREIKKRRTFPYFNQPAKGSQEILLDVDIEARIDGREDDRIDINEIGHLIGEGARGALKSSIAVRDQAVATVRNTINKPFSNLQDYRLP